MTSPPTSLGPAPLEWNEFLARYKVSELQRSYDLALTPGGDLAVARTGDLMLSDEITSALHRCVSTWYYSWPALAELFERTAESRSVEEVVARASRSREEPRFLRATLEEHRFNQMRRYVSAEGIIMVSSRILLSLHLVLGGNEYLWKRTGPLIEGHSFGACLRAAANHLRHCEEWRLSETVDQRSKPSIAVLARLLREPLSDSKHRLGTPRPLEILEAIAGLSLDELSGFALGFANNLATSYRNVAPT